jgi:sarcosine oxidase subunit alpha
MSGGYSPAVHLYCQAGGSLRYDAKLAALVPDQSRQACHVAGAVAGTERLEDCLAEGARVGVEAVQAAGFTERRGLPVPAAPEPEIQPIRPLWLVPGKREVGHGRAKHMVDHQDDVTAADIMLAAREGFRSVEHVKRYTTAGMGTDQGKTSNVNALAILAQATGRSIPEVGTTTYRAPYTPVTFGALAGRDTGAQLDPVRRTAMHTWHEQNGALFELVGQWHRPWWYPKAGEDKHTAVARECTAVREAVGILDASTLGKIDIQGPDAAELLNRVYTNAWSKLAVGRVRYGLMCGEDGMVFDDGTTSRLGENHYLMTTTTGNAARVLAWLEEWLQTEWPELRVHCTSVTEQWASVALAGPKARDVLAAVAPDLALDDAAFPFMSHQQAEIAGIPARIFRISFSGGLGFEINVPWNQGLALWKSLMAAGADHGITPYGTEAMHVLRAEKGFIIVGQETDGTTTPIDLGLEGLVSKKKPDFIGKRSLARTDTKRANRKQLVGLLTDDPNFVLPEGAQLVTDTQTETPVPMVGHVTSSYMSPALGRSIALALVKSGRKNIGKTLHAPLAGKTVTATITEPRFLEDPKSE